MASKEAVEAVQFRGTHAAKVSPGTGALQLFTGTSVVQGPHELSQRRTNVKNYLE